MLILKEEIRERINEEKKRSILISKAENLGELISNPIR
jgi:sRNA-binding carbon storage regulator CsrA